MKKEKFEGSFRKYQKLVKYVVWEKTSDRMLAEEIVQQVFCEFYVHIEEIRPEAEKAWLLRCTRNKVVDYLRGKQRWSSVLMDVGGTNTGNLLVEEETLRPEERLEMEEFTERILRQVRAHNAQWYEAMILCFVEGMSYAEAAERLNISVTLLRARISRARAYIKKYFWDEYKNGHSEA
ncbi:MAG: sigma-70 family RNA polymerase sigma factor [Lachnospiraceae bacterium]|nr:sigma-70 family RNA polymerase sigma factor [Lachnospiraceae bacterium]